MQTTETEGVKECRKMQDKLLDAGVPVTLEALTRLMITNYIFVRIAHVEKRTYQIIVIMKIFALIMLCYDCRGLLPPTEYGFSKPAFKTDMSPSLPPNYSSG